MDYSTLFKYGMNREIKEPLSMPLGVVLNLGAGKGKYIHGAIPLDLPEWDADRDPIPYRDEEVDGIHCYHFIEHVKEPIKLLLEIQRVLKPGGILNLCVPYYKSSLAFQDLDHKHFFNEETWKCLFKNEYYDKNAHGWKLDVRLNVIMGIVERNLSLLTQMVKSSK